MVIIALTDSFPPCRQLSKVLCIRCQNKQMAEAESLRELLGQGCDDIIEKLNDLQPCEHLRETA